MKYARNCWAFTAPQRTRESTGTWLLTTRDPHTPTDRTRFTGALSLQTFTGVAPVTSQSGNTRTVAHRWACPKFHKQTFHEYAGLSTTKSKWAKAYYDMMLSRGKKPQMARRALAYKWQRIIFRCWQGRVPYDESRYIARLHETNSPLLAFMDAE